MKDELNRRVEDLEEEMGQVVDVLKEISAKLDSLATGDDITKLRTDLLQGFTTVWEHTGMVPKLPPEED